MCNEECMRPMQAIVQTPVDEKRVGVDYSLHSPIGSKRKM